MSPRRREPDWQDPESRLTKSEAEFIRWMDELDLDTLDLDRLNKQAESELDESDDED